MSLSESFRHPPGHPIPDAPPDQSAPSTGGVELIDPQLFKLRDALTGILAIAGEQTTEQPRAGKIFIFRGELLISSEEAFALLTERFHALDFTPMLQREGDEVAVIAVAGALPDTAIRTRAWLHLALLVITFFTTTIMGAALTGFPWDRTVDALLAWDLPVLLPALREGLPFSLTLLAILGTHEMGHYIAARRHGVKVTLPFFIPLPLTGSLGTLGAVIFIRSPFLNRRALFDVGIAGPLAGLVVALPLYVIGLQQQATVGRPLTLMAAGIQRVANPPLLKLLASFVVDVPNLDSFVFYGHPMAFAAWFGVLLTAMNLLPMGQFDGGHVAYALLGRRAWPLAITVFFTLVTLAWTTGWTLWLIWAIMAALTGLRHPPPHDDLTPLDWNRRSIGIATALIFMLIVVPVPLYGV